MCYNASLVRMVRHALSARQCEPPTKMMSGEYDGRVKDALPSDLFVVELDGRHSVLAHLSGELRMNVIRILPGDRVRVKVSSIDLSRGRIVRRYQS